MAKPTYKREIAIQYCEKYFDFSTRAIARLLIKDHPLDFTESNARSFVQLLRNENNGRKGVFESRDSETKKQFMKRNFELPESDYQKTENFIIPKGQNNILILSDIHFPYQDNKALNLALEYGIENKVNAIYLNGDTLDMYHGSRFVKDRRKRDLASELEIGRNFLKQLQEVFKCPIYFKIGNHCDRWENYLRLQAPELLGIADFKLEQVLKVREYGTTIIESKQIAMAGKLPIMHGHEWFGGFAPPVNPARGLYLKAKESCIIGHHHRTSEHTEKNLKGEVTTTWSTGCLCGLQPEYMPFNNWNHGFAHVTVNNDGSYNVKNIRIIDYKIV